MERPQGCLSRVPRVVAGFLVIVIILTAPVALLARAAGQVVFSPEVMAEIIGNRLLQTDVTRRVLAEALMSSLTEPTEAAGGEVMGSLLSGVKRSDMEKIMEIVLPPGWGKDQIVANLSAIYAWVDSDQAVPRIELDLEPIRSRLLSGGAADLVGVLIDAWPNCTPEQVARMGVAAIQGGTIEACKPPEPIRSVVAGVMADLVHEVANSMPRSVDLGPQLVSGEGAAQIGLFKERVRMVRFLTSWSWLLPASLLGLVVALVVRSLSSLCRWWGVPLTASGLLALVLLLPFSGLARALGRDLASQLQGRPLLLEAVAALGSGVVQQIMVRAAIGALLLTIGGAGLLFAGWLMTRKARRIDARTAAAPADRRQEPAVGGGEEVLPGGDEDRPTGAFG